MPRDALLTAGPLQVRFTWQGDRFGHEISLLTGEGPFPLLQSVEGAASDAWPPSPPLQSVHVEPRGAEHVALAVGMAGASHWSASVETLPEGRLRFDLACRIRGEPHGLGSRYRIMPGVAAEADDMEIRFSCEAGACRLAVQDVDGHRALLQVEPGQIALLVPPQALSAATARWCYTLES